MAVEMLPAKNVPWFDRDAAFRQGLDWSDAEDAHNVRHLREELRQQPSDVVIRMDCFSSSEADRYRAMLSPDELKRVFFTWCV